MACLVPVGDLTPQHPAFLAPTATLVGDVRFGADCSIWFGAVLRGDINHIELGDRANVQDNCVLHVSKVRPCVIGARTSLGHGAIAH
ncbi:MAG: gamma carbonic anhydrase family protein, partial [Planctomycetota bacterium]